MEELIRVRILSRDYPLRVAREDAASTRRLAVELHERMEDFKRAHPDQSDLVAAVVTALGLAEELVIARRQGEGLAEDFSRALDELDRELAEALVEP